MRSPSRSLAIAVLISALIGVSSLGSSSSAAAEGDGAALVVAPASGPVGTTVTISDGEPCPPPPQGETLTSVVVELVDFRDTRTARVVEVSPDANREWRGTLTIDAGLRNGGYDISAICVAQGATTEDSDPYALYEGSFLVTSPAGQPDPVVRLAGADRIATAVAISRDEFLDPAFGAVLTRADSFADALAGSALAQYLAQPLLLTNRGSLDQRVEAELSRVAGAGGEITVLGGTAAIAPEVVDRLVSLGYSVTRIAGQNRFGTATAIADEVVGNPSTVMLADGLGFKDGLIAGAAARTADDALQPASTNQGSGAVVLLTNGTAVPPETQAYLDAHPTAARFAVGGKAAAAVPAATAIVGATAAETSVKVAQRFFPDPWAVGLANDRTFADGLAGGAHVPELGGPLLLTDSERLSPSVQAYLDSTKSIPIAFLYGGSAALSDSVAQATRAAIS